MVRDTQSADDCSEDQDASVILLAACYKNAVIKKDMGLKILFFSHRFYPDVGGIEVNTEILANAFRDAGHTVRLLTWSEDATEKKFPFEVKRNPGFAVLFKANLWADVVFENNPCLRLSWMSFFFNKPSIVALCTLVGSADVVNNLPGKLKMYWLKRAKAVIAVSNAVRRKCWPAATVIANPYRTDIFKLAGANARPINFAFLGRLVSEKGADLAIQAIHKMLVSGYNGKIISTEGPVLTIIGDGPCRRDLEDLVEKLQLRDAVKFAGTLTGPSLVACLNKHKYLLVPSVYEEPFGNVVLEGMACGCIPIVSDGGGLPEAVGGGGLVFRKGDVNALVSCILKVVNSPDLQTQLRNSAADHLAGHHPEAIADRYLRVIENAVKP